MIFLRSGVATILLCCCTTAFAEVIAYTGATLIDGTGREAVGIATILVEGDRFLAVGRELNVPPEARIVDVRGKWIVPGLIDSHIHFMTSGRMYTRPAFFDLTEKVSYEEEVAWIKAHIPDTLRAFLCSGVTGVLSLGGPSLEYNARDLALTMADAPTVFIGHGVFAFTPEFFARRAIPPWDGELTVKPVTSTETAAALVQEAVSRDADLIKTALNDRGSMLLRFMLGWLDWRELQGAIIDQANKHGLRVTTHAHALNYAQGAPELGVASLQHIPADQSVDEAFIGVQAGRPVTRPHDRTRKLIEDAGQSSPGPVSASASCSSNRAPLSMPPMA